MLLGDQVQGVLDQLDKDGDVQDGWRAIEQLFGDRLEYDTLKMMHLAYYAGAASVFVSIGRRTIQ